MKNRINWKVRVKNPYFWLGLGGAVIAASGISPETITSWHMIGQVFVDFISNPFAVISVVIAIIGVVLDPTTSGISDSQRALHYNTIKDSDLIYAEEMHEVELVDTEVDENAIDS